MISNVSRVACTSSDLPMSETKPSRIAGKTLGEHRGMPGSNGEIDDAPLVQTTGKSLRAQIEDNTTTRIRAVWPLITHFILTFVIAVVVITLIDHHSFSITSRWPDVIQADASVTRLGFTLLQSDITTALSSSLTMTRFVAVLWTASTVWRCIFILLEKEGIDLRDIAWMLHWGLPARLKGTTFLQIAVILLASFPIQFSSPILMGSITWKPSEFSVVGDKLVTGISVSTYGYEWDQYSRYTPQIGDTVIQLGTGIADIAWGKDGDDTASSIKRVLPTTRPLPTGAILNNVTVPYFVVDAFEWIENPDIAISQIWSTDDAGNHFNPFMNAEGPYVGFFPVNGTWGPSPSSDAGLPQPTIMSETRILVTLVDRVFNTTNTTGCTNRTTRYYGEIASDISLVPAFYEDPPSSSSGVTNCYTYARVTYRAGVRSCNKCSLSAQTVLQFGDGSTASELQPDVMTSDALALAPMLAQSMIMGNISVPSPINNINDFVPEVLSRSYQAAWTALTDKFQSPLTSTATSVVIPVQQLSQAHVVRWRVYIWMVLNFMLMLSGVCFFYVQSSCQKRMVIDAQIATLLLDSGEVLRDHAKRQLDDLSILTDKDVQEVGQLRLVEENGRRMLTYRGW